MQIEAPIGESHPAVTLLEQALRLEPVELLRRREADAVGEPQAHRDPLFVELDRGQRLAAGLGQLAAPQGLEVALGAAVVLVAEAADAAGRSGAEREVLALRPVAGVVARVEPGARVVRDL